MSWLSPIPDDAEQVAWMEAQAPDLYRLASRLAPALRVEPLLLRNARMAFMPDTDAGIESAFWMCDLIASRSARAVVMRPGIARLLTDRLTDAQYRSVIRVIEENTAHWPWHDRLEQAMRWQARAGETDALQAAMRQVLGRLARAADDARRLDIARWAKGALPAALPEDHGIDEAAWLAQFAAAALGDAGAPLARRAARGQPLPGWLAERLPTTVAGQTVGLRWHPRLLVCLPAGKGDHDLALPTPVPAPVHIRCEPQGAGRWEVLWPGRQVPVPDCRSLVLQPLAGPPPGAWPAAWRREPRTRRPRPLGAGWPYYSRPMTSAWLIR